MTTSQTVAAQEPQDRITPTERRELRSLVRNLFKVLREEVKQRERELLGNVNRRVTERYVGDDERFREFQAAVDKLIGKANRDLGKLVTDLEASGDQGRWNSRPRVEHYGMTRRYPNREQLREALTGGVSVAARRALLDVDRMEAGLLRDLAVDALRTDAARSFLDRVPDVEALLPATKLAEIEAGFEQAVSA